MRMHGSAALSLIGRRRMVLRVVEQGWSITQAALAAEVSERICSKWVGRYRPRVSWGSLVRSSAPLLVANRTEEHTRQAIAALRRLRFTGPEIAQVLDRPLSTVSGILKRMGMGKLGRRGLQPAVRYERARPGELIHSDVKKLGRIHGGAGKRITGGVKRNPNAAASTPRALSAGSSAGTPCTSPLTTPPAWPTPRSSATSERSPRWVPHPRAGVLRAPRR
jgi:hypothetical protein